MLSSFTRFLLSSIAKNEQFTNETHSIRRRFQILCLIYMIFASFLLIISFCLIFSISLKDPSMNLNTACSFPFLLASLYLIRIKKLNAAAAALGIVFHMTNLITSELLPFPLVSLLSLLIYPYFLLLVTSSVKVLVLNGIVCITRFFFLARKVHLIFYETINQEQSLQITSVMVTLFSLIFSVSVMSICQKYMELVAWESTEENLMKSVNQTKEAVEAMEAKNRFISMISHEIRNPLNAIKGSIDCLGQMITDKGHLKILENAKIGGEVLLNLVNNVLDAAKLKSEKIEIIYNETVFLDVLKKALIVNSGLLKEKGLQARVYLEENLPKTLYIDSSRLLQVLMNLISNAIKFTAKKGTIEVYVSFCSKNEEKDKLLAPIRKNTPAREIKMSLSTRAEESSNTDFLDTTIEEMSMIETESFTQKVNRISKFQVKSMRDLNGSHSTTDDPWEIFKIRLGFETLVNQNQSQGYLKIQVSDNGCGISDEDKGRLFGMFEQVAECSRQIQGGSGLGLWICKQLCKRMNGDITVYSTVGKGSSFVFYLPVNGSDGSQLGIKKPTITKALVVDDVSTNLYLHKFLLEQQGVKVVTAWNGKEAIEKYQVQGDEPFSFVFMDVDMPEMNGFSAAIKIREWEVRNNVRPCEIYFVTGEYLSGREVKREYVKRGGNQREDIKHVRKPLGLEELKSIVDKFKLSFG